MALSFPAVGIASACFAALALSAVPASATFFGSRDGPAIGLGTACAAVMEGTARQPEAVAELTDRYREAASAILAFGHRGQKDVPQGIALYKIQQITGVARQPEVEAKLIAISDECGADLAALAPSRPDRAAVAIGEMCAALLDGVARQPEAETQLLAAYADGVRRIAATRPRSSTQVKAEALGLVKAGQITALSRQSEVAAKLASAADVCARDIGRY
jgi:F0F1-type ATP synthase membrane subunit c/vacuolar-type H+-ATPase subunit K